MILSDLQHTIGATVSFEGVGLHTGEHAQLRILPAEPNTGYVFVRIDLEGSPEVAGVVSNVSETRRGTTLQSDEATVHTTEHVLAALRSGHRQCTAELNGPEVPILDGSAQPFMDAITNAGSTQQDAPRKTFRVRNN